MMPNQLGCNDQIIPRIPAGTHTLRRGSYTSLEGAYNILGPIASCPCPQKMPSLRAPGGKSRVPKVHLPFRMSTSTLTEKAAPEIGRRRQQAQVFHHGSFSVKTVHDGTASLGRRLGTHQVSSNSAWLRCQGLLFLLYKQTQDEQ